METNLGELSAQLATLMDTITNLDVIDVPSQVDALAAAVDALRAQVEALEQAVIGLGGMPGTPPPDHSDAIAQIQQQITAIGAQIEGLQMADTGLAGNIASLDETLGARIDAVAHAVPVLPVTLHGLDTNLIEATGTTEDVTLFTTTKQADEWRVGDVFHVEMGGDMSGTGGSKTIRVLINGEYAWANAMTQSSQGAWGFHLQVIMRSEQQAIFVARLTYHVTRPFVHVHVIDLDLSIENTLEIAARLGEPSNVWTREFALARTVSQGQG